VVFIRILTGMVPEQIKNGVYFKDWIIVVRTLSSFFTRRQWVVFIATGTMFQQELDGIYRRNLRLLPVSICAYPVVAD
jgi:hypothetical protein